MPRCACTLQLWQDRPLEQALDELADAGYEGAELLEQTLEPFARQPGRLRALLEERSLVIAAVHCAGTWFERSERMEELERVRRLAGTLADLESRGVLLFRTIAHPARRDTLAGSPPALPLDYDRMGRLAETLEAAADIGLSAGLTGAVLNRAGTYVETPDEVMALAERTDPSIIRLAIDVGHWIYAGGDARPVIEAEMTRLAYLRLADVDRRVYEQTVERRAGFAAFTRTGGFVELGEGTLDLEHILQPIERSAIWIAAGLEGASRPPRESARISREFLRDRLHW